MPETPHLAEESAAVCLTVGDPTGIGQEVAVKFLQRFMAGDVFNSASDSLSNHSPNQSGIRPLIVFGDLQALIQESERQGVRLPDDNHRVRYVDIRSQLPDLPASVEAHAGRVAYQSLEAAVAEIHAQRAAVLVTGPISKENLRHAGLSYSGHTEILQDLAERYYGQTYQSDMLFVYRGFRMLLLTRHVALREVSNTLSISGVQKSLDSLSAFLQQRCRIPKPRLCILGVNPHAGELDGDEEEFILQPALNAISQRYGFEIEPPVAADAAFRGFDIEHLSYDAYVAAYHDQGLIPFKLVAGLNAVNVTIGLPFLRTSVSHGTAPDIVGKNLASPNSLVEAYKAAIEFL